MKAVTILAGAVLVLSACSTSKSVVPIGATEVASVVDARVQSGEVPDADDYATARASFVSSLTGFMAERQREARSPSRKIKSAIVGAGSMLGAGGLIASFIVSNDDTRSTVAQASAGAAAVSGIVGLIPMGRGASGAAAVVAYLEAELPRFEQRWPVEKDSLTVAEWNFFYSDGRHIEEVAAELQTIR